LKKEERAEDEEYYYKMLGRMYLRRGTAQAWNSQYDAAIVDLKRAMEYTNLFKEPEIAKIKNDIKQIEKRKESQEVKLSGDLAFARNQLDEALENYRKALELDVTNEYVLSNISVIYLKRQDYENCMIWTNKALELIEGFQPDTKEFQPDNTLEVKLLQRRAKCYELKDEFELAKQDLDRAMMLDRDNTAVKLAQQKVQ
jgi:tetratricopeptide (TPR) repeat protein